MVPLFIHSLEKQTFRDLEIIIVDGNSRDGSLEMFKDWAAWSSFSVKVIVDATHNIGYIRNLGARHASGQIIFTTSSDIYFPANLLERIDALFVRYPHILSVSGRTFPLGSGTISYLAYGAFDFIRFLFTVSPFPLHKFRPAGNFVTIRRWLHEQIGGFPEVKINEDGLYGQRIDEFLKANPGTRAVYHLGLYVVHKVKRFERKGGVKAMLFYLYVFGNMFPMLKRFLDPLEKRSGDQFATRSDLGVK